jgi:hypothetical protein
MKVLIVPLFLVLICSCSNKDSLPQNQTNRDTIKVINLLPLTDSIITNLSDIASDIEYLPLQTPRDIRITGIFKIVSCSCKIYINSGRNLVCFDKSGHFLYALNTGESPDFISDFDISSDDSTLVILSENKILIFKNTDTRFIFQKFLNLKRPHPSKISIVPETNNLLLSIIPSKGNESSLSLLIDVNGDTLFLKPNCYRYKKADKATYGSEDEIIHYKTGNNLCFKERFSDTIFFVSKGSKRFSPWLILDSKGKSYPAWARGNSENAEYFLEEYSEVERIFEVPNYIFYNYSYVYRKVGFAWHRKILYDRRTDRKIEIKLNNYLKDDLCGGPDFNPSDVSEGELYSFINSSVLKFYTSGEEFISAKVLYPQKKEDLQKLADTLKKTDNSVLIKVIIKN